MKLIPSSEALAFLSQAAPRPWVHRFLCWMVFNDGLKLYASEGKIQPYCAVGEFFDRLQAEAGEFSGPKMDALIRQKYEADIADRLAGQGIHERFNDDLNVWCETDEPVEVDGGFIIFAQELDWNSGIIKATAIEGHGDTFDLFFWNQSDQMGTWLPRPSYDAELSGLKFEFSEIELLLPNAALQQSFTFAPQANVRQSPIGRPARWDWEGAMMSVIAEAQKPDGLPTGHGAQARIEELIAAWFTDQSGDCPAPSQVRQRAAKIMRGLERPETPES